MLASKVAMPTSRRGVDVADPLGVGVVEMAAHLLDREVAQRPLHRRLHLLRRADADGVGDAAVVDADLLHQLDDVLDLVGADLALVGTAERHRDRGADLDALGLGGVDHRPEALDALGDRAVDVAPAEGLARGGEDHDLVGPLFARRRQGGVEALHVRHQHRIAHPGLAGDAGHDGGVVAHLRHPLRADEAGDLDLLQPGVLEPLHQLDLDARVDGLLLVLQAVARADVDQGHAARQCAHRVTSLWAAGGIGRR